MTESGLKSCPFCGGKAALGTIKYIDSTVREQEWKQATFHKVNCILCASTNLGRFKSPTEAIEHWNRRALSDHAEAGQLRAALQQIVEEAPSSNPLHRIAAKALANIGSGLGLPETPHPYPQRGGESSSAAYFRYPEKHQENVMSETAPPDVGDDHEVLFTLEMACEHDERHQAQALRTWLPRISEWYRLSQSQPKPNEGGK